MNANTRLIDLTVGELTDLVTDIIRSNMSEQRTSSKCDVKRLVYGLDGLAELFGCSKTRACEIKRSGVIDKAVTQIGRKIVTDAELALQLINEKNRKNKRQ